MKWVNNTHAARRLQLLIPLFTVGMSDAKAEVIKVPSRFCVCGPHAPWLSTHSNADRSHWHPRRVQLGLTRTLRSWHGATQCAEGLTVFSLVIFVLSFASALGSWCFVVTSLWCRSQLGGINDPTN